MSEKLEAIRDQASSALCRLFTDAIPEMESAIQEVVAQAQEDETAPVFKVAFSIKYDLDKNKITHQLSYTMKHKWECGADVPDPSQPEMVGVLTGAAKKPRNN